MRIAVIGNKGMLARDLTGLIDEAGISQWGADLPELDITRSEEVKGELKASGATVVINCAAYTAVDRAESQPDVAFAVNRDGVRNLAFACRDLNIPLIHISTDYVFDGALRRPYREDDPPCPLGVYGESKWAGENELSVIHGKHVIVRTSWLFGAMGQSFVKTILRLAQEKDDLRVVNDQFGCPTWSADLAEVLTRIAKEVEKVSEFDKVWGTYHYCGMGETTWWGFANEIIALAEGLIPMKTRSVAPIETAEFPTPAKRPLWSVLDCSKIEQTFGIQRRPWQNGLAAVIHTIASSG